MTELQIGDDVTIERGLHQGKTGEVVEVDTDKSMVTVEVSLFGQARQTQVPFSDITRISDDPDEVFGSVVEQVRDALRKPLETRLNQWWARKALAGVEASEALLDEFYAFRKQVEQEFEEAVGQRVLDLKDDIDTSDAAAMRVWLADNRESLEREWSDRVEELEVTLRDEAFEADEIADKTRAALELDDRPDYVSDEQIELQAAREMIKPLVDAGLELWRASRDIALPPEEEDADA
jgi:ribosomal protein L24